MLKASNGEKVIYTTKKMFKLIYEAQGYTLEEVINEKIPINKEDKSYSEMNVTDLRKIAKTKGIGNSGKLSREELLKLLQIENDDTQKALENVTNENGETQPPGEGDENGITNNEGTEDKTEN